MPRTPRTLTPLQKARLVEAIEAYRRAHEDVAVKQDGLTEACQEIAGAGFDPAVSDYPLEELDDLIGAVEEEIDKDAGDSQLTEEGEEPWNDEHYDDFDRPEEGDEEEDDDA